MPRARSLITSILLVALVASAFLAALEAQQQVSGDTTVYINTRNREYHRIRCPLLSRNFVPIAIKDAVDRGYAPHRQCEAPILEPVEPVLPPAQGTPAAEPVPSAVGDLVAPVLLDKGAQWITVSRGSVSYEWHAEIENPNPAEMPVVVVVRLHNAADAVIHEARYQVRVRAAATEIFAQYGSVAESVAAQASSWSFEALLATADNVAVAAALSGTNPDPATQQRPYPLTQAHPRSITQPSPRRPAAPPQPVAEAPVATVTPPANEERARYVDWLRQQADAAFAASFDSPSPLANGVPQCSSLEGQPSDTPGSDICLQPVEFRSDDSLFPKMVVRVGDVTHSTFARLQSDLNEVRRLAAQQNIDTEDTNVFASTQLTVTSALVRLVFADPRASRLEVAWNRAAPPEYDV